MSCFPGQNQSQCFWLPLLPIMDCNFFISQKGAFFILPVRSDKGLGTIFSDRESKTINNYEINNAIPAFKKTAPKIASKVVTRISWSWGCSCLWKVVTSTLYMSFLDHYQCCQQWSYTFKKHYLLFEQWAYNYKLVPPPYRNFLPPAKLVTFY